MKKLLKLFAELKIIKLGVINKVKLAEKSFIQPAAKLKKVKLKFCYTEGAIASQQSCKIHQLALYQIWLIQILDAIEPQLKKDNF